MIVVFHRFSSLLNFARITQRKIQPASPHPRDVLGSSPGPPAYLPSLDDGPLEFHNRPSADGAPEQPCRVEREAGIHKEAQRGEETVRQLSVGIDSGSKTKYFVNLHPYTCEGHQGAQHCCSEAVRAINRADRSGRLASSSGFSASRLKLGAP